MARSGNAYWGTVQAIAEEAVEEYGDNTEDASEYIWESVDGSEYIIYYDGIDIVLEESRNEPDAGEVSAMAGPDADWRKQQQVAAFMAMEADVMEAYEDLLSEYVSP